MAVLLCQVFLGKNAVRKGRYLAFHNEMWFKSRQPSHNKSVRCQKCNHGSSSVCQGATETDKRFREGRSCQGSALTTVIGTAAGFIATENSQGRFALANENCWSQEGVWFCHLHKGSLSARTLLGANRGLAAEWSHWIDICQKKPRVGQLYLSDYLIKSYLCCLAE